MSATHPSAADFIDGHDEDVSPGLAEVAEFVARFSTAWTRARLSVRKDPSAAYAALAEAEGDYERYVEVRLLECMGRIRSALDLLESELPDELAPDKGDRSVHAPVRQRLD